MENKKLFAIIMERGEYDTFHTDLIAVTDDYEKASRYVEEKNTTFQSMSDKLDSYNTEIIKWKENNPSYKNRFAQKDFTYWSDRLDEVTNNWVKSNLTESEALLFKNKDDNRWYVEEVNWL